MPEPTDPAIVAEAVDHKTTASRPVEPVTVTVVASADASRLQQGTVATTPGIHAPNIIVSVVPPILAVAIRFANAFLTALLGILTGAMASDIIPASDFLHLVYKCAGLAVAGAGVGLIKDLITIFGRLEQKNPLLTGSV